MDKQYFIVLCTTVDLYDISKAHTVIESFYDFSGYSQLETQRVIIGETGPCDFSRYINFNSLRQRMNPHRRYDNYVVSVDSSSAGEFEKMLSADNAPDELVKLIINRGKQVRI